MQSIRHPWRAFVALFLVSSAAFAVQSSMKAAAVQRAAFVSLESTSDVRAAPDKVWSALTSASGFCALTGFECGAARMPLAKIGDHAAATCAGDKGVLVCTYVQEGKELRASFEPDSGAYVCHHRVLLSGQGATTRVTIRDAYSDEKAATADETAKKAAAEQPKHVEAFKAMCEKP